jgi:hypothetical protein
VRVLTSRIEGLCWTLAALLVVLAGLAQTRGAGWTNDGFQYLSVARNVLDGHGLSTSIVHFDEQYFTGRIPAAQTVFPPGYPAVVAGVAWLGVPVEVAALVVSVASAVLLIPVLRWGGALLNVRPWALRWFLFLWVTSSAASWYAGGLLSEPLFTFAASLGLVLLLRAEVGERRGEGGRWYLLLGALLLGAAFWVRYAGLFLVAGVLCYYLVKLAIRRDRAAGTSFLLAATSVPLVLAGFLRNAALSGTAFGGNTKVVTRSVPELLSALVNSSVALLVGPRSPKMASAGFWVLAAVLVVCAAGLSLFLLASLVKDRSAVFRRLREVPVPLVAVFLGFYLCGLLYAGRNTVISFKDPRMLYPMGPALLLLLAALCSGVRLPSAPRLARALGLLLLGATAACYGVLQFRDVVLARAQPAYYERVQRDVSEPVGTSASLGDWLAAHVPAGQPIIAGDGQACGYLLRKNTISLVTTEYSPRPWTEDRLRQTARSYNAPVLILFPHGRDTRTVAAESPFIDDVLNGRCPPWLTLAAENGAVKVFAIAPGETARGAAKGQSE